MAMHPGETLGIDTEDEADYVLERILAQEVMIAAQRRYLETITRNVEAQIRRHEALIRSIRDRYEVLLEDYARHCLDGKKERTVHLHHGDLALRQVPPSYRITDREDAVAYVRARQPQLVATTYTVSAKNALLAIAAHGDDPESMAWLQAIPAHDSFTIRTNLEPHPEETTDGD
jgi:hypothetical protein